MTPNPVQNDPFAPLWYFAGGYKPVYKPHPYTGSAFNLYKNGAHVQVYDRYFYRKVSVIPYDLSELRGMLGVGKTAYREYTQFRRSVLERIQADIREKTDICFEFRPVRRGRRVSVVKAGRCAATF